MFEKIPSKKASAAAANRSLKASAGGLKKVSGCASSGLFQATRACVLMPV